jgi:exodeoxyribonuclease VII small subunit
LFWQCSLSRALLKGISEQGHAVHVKANRLGTEKVAEFLLAGPIHSKARQNHTPYWMEAKGWLPKDDSMSDAQNELSYEEAYQQLEQVLQALESGDLALEQSLKLYELGATLTAYCARKLDEAELRVRQWQPDDQTTSLDDWQEI